MLHRIAMLRKLPSPVVNPNLSKTVDGTQQNFALRKGAGNYKSYMSINFYLHINPYPVIVQAY